MHKILLFTLAVILTSTTAGAACTKDPEYSVIASLNYPGFEIQYKREGNQLHVYVTNAWKHQVTVAFGETSIKAESQTFCIKDVSAWKKGVRPSIKILKTRKPVLLSAGGPANLYETYVQRMVTENGKQGLRTFPLNQLIGHPNTTCTLSNNKGETIDVSTNNMGTSDEIPKDFNDVFFCE